MRVQDSADARVVDVLIPQWRQTADVGVIESLAIKSQIDPRPWIRNFIEVRSSVDLAIFRNTQRHAMHVCPGPIGTSTERAVLG